MFKPSSARADVGLYFIGLGFVLIVLGLSYYFVGTQAFEATARVKLEKEHTDIGHSYLDPFWIPSELERIQAKVVLYAVITNLNLTSRWAASGPKGDQNEQ